MGKAAQHVWRTSASSSPIIFNARWDPHPITAQCTHCNLWCAHPCRGALQQPLPIPTYRGGIYPGTIPGDAQP